ncbi:MAG: Ig-like domain-containing protein [Thermoanaerobaculia bacterium]
MNVIRIARADMQGVSYDLNSAGSRRRLAHEIGHVLGLNDDSCTDSIMHSIVLDTDDVRAEHCALAEFENCAVGQDCPADPRNQFLVGGSISGLMNGGRVSLDLQVGAASGSVDSHGNGTFRFLAPTVPQGGAYAVSIFSSPADQPCSVAGGAGLMPATDYLGVRVVCNCATQSQQLIGCGGGGGVPHSPFNQFFDECMGFGLPFCGGASGWWITSLGFPRPPSGPPAAPECTAGEVVEVRSCGLRDVDGDGVVEPTDCETTDWVDISCPEPSLRGDQFLSTSTVMGPTLGLALPQSGATLRGRNWITGWAADRQGVADYSFWIDFNQIELQNFQGSQQVANACQQLGGSSPFCSPTGGFRGLLDTSSLSVGPHLLSVAALDGRSDFAFTSIASQPINVARCQGLAPTATIGSPGNGQTVSGSLWIGVGAAGESDIVTTELLVDGSSFGFDDLPPLGWTWNSRNYSNGSHQLRVRATDGCGNVALSPITTVTVSNAVPAPTVLISLPAAGSTVSGSVQIAAEASDRNAINRVEFFADGGLVGTDSASPYATAWNTLSGATGAHSLSARAFNASGVSTLSASVSVLVANPVQNAPPQVWIDVPSQNASVQSRYLAWYGWATDAGAVNTFAFQVDGVAKSLTVSRGPRADVCNAIPVGDPNCPNVGWGVTLDLFGMAAGSHTLSVTVTDNLGATATISRVIQIVNSAATAWVGYPNLGRTVSGTAVNVVGWATDTDGVESVRLEIDNQPATLSVPWVRIPWTDACAAGSPLDPNCPNVGYKMTFNSTSYSDGAHTLRVIVRDTRGLDSVSTHSLTFRNSPIGTKVTRSAIADTFIQSASPTSASGGSATFLYLKQATNDLKYTFLKFDLTGISGQLVAARLKLVAQSSTAPRANLWRISAGTWSESTFTWNGLSGLTFSLFDVFFDLPTLPAGTATSFDVTDMVLLGGTVTFGLSTEIGPEISFASREFSTSGKRPILEIWTH